MSLRHRHRHSRNGCGSCSMRVTRSSCSPATGQTGWPCRFRPAIWSSGLECYLAELYVTPGRRGRGLGRALMEAALREARDLGADTMEIGVDEPDLAARRLYESLGFTNRSGEDGSVMYFYERDL
jgi:GNAT superfamily N-acetyltransferase